MQMQMAEPYQSRKVNVSEHIKNIFKESELDLVATVRKFRIVASDVKNHEVNCYNIYMIISLSYRIKPSIAIYPGD